MGREPIVYPPLLFGKKKRPNIFIFKLYPIYARIKTVEDYFFPPVLDLLIDV